MHLVTRSLPPFALRQVALAAAAVTVFALAGCSTISDTFSGDKIDYRSGGNKTSGLEVPPDLTQLSKDSRYQQSGGSVSAAAFQAPLVGGANVAPTTPNVAPQSVGSSSIERQGNERWLRSTLSPEQLWPQLQAFWKERGFTIVQDTPTAGVMETDWAENRAKLPQDFIRASIGKVFDGAYSTASSTSSAPASNAVRAAAARSTSRTVAWSRRSPARTRIRRSGSRVRPTRNSRPNCSRV